MSPIHRHLTDDEAVDLAHRLRGDRRARLRDARGCARCERTLVAAIGDVERFRSIRATITDPHGRRGRKT